MNAAWLAGGIFLVTYALIVTERCHRTVSALLGGMAMILLGLLDQEEAFGAVDWNVILLLVGMMALANILRETGLFQWVAVKAVRLGKGSPFRILVILSFVTAFASALLDNVTVVVLVAPVTFFVAASLGASPVPFLISEILASNIGGMATLIGDPPNILIGSAAGYDFVTFAWNMAPIALLILLAFLCLSWFLFRRDLRSRPARRLDIEALEAEVLITDRKLLRKGLIVMGLVLAGFLFQGLLGVEPATLALSGAALLMLWARIDPAQVLRDVEWSTLLFFLGLFITVEAVGRVGLIDAVAQGALRLTGGNLTLTSVLLLWLSGLASAIVDNIPYTTALIPVVESLGEAMRIDPLWWALALGACLGGNATLVGASANVVVASLATRSGHPISFARFLRYGLVTAFLSLLLATLYLWLRYL